MSSIPIADPVLGKAERDRVLEVLDDGQLADGIEVRRFEDEFADHCRGEHAVATANGTTALHAALHAVGVGQGDTVVTTPFSFVATANAIRHCGATPVFADIDPRTYNIDPGAVESVVEGLDGEVAALVPVHLYGLPADMETLAEIADTYDLAIVEDAAQAHGAEYGGSPVGSFGDAACYSFYPTKNMTTGEGGMVTTDSENVAAGVRRLINHGRADGDGLGYEHVEVGYNFRMTSIAAAIGRAQLDRLPGFVRTRRAHAAVLSEALKGLPGIEVPVEPGRRRHAFHQYTIRCADREAVRARLTAAGIGSGVYYPTPIHRQPAYAGVDRQYPVAERASREVLSLPVHPSLTDEDVRAVADTVRECAVVEGRPADD